MRRQVTSIESSKSIETVEEYTKCTKEPSNSSTNLTTDNSTDSRPPSIHSSPIPNEAPKHTNRPLPGSGSSLDLPTPGDDNIQTNYCIPQPSAAHLEQKNPPALEPALDKTNKDLSKPSKVSGPAVADSLCREQSGRGKGHKCMTNLQGSFIEEDLDDAYGKFFDDIAADVEAWTCVRDTPGYNEGLKDGEQKTTCIGSHGNTNVHHNRHKMVAANLEAPKPVAIIPPTTGGCYGTRKDRQRGLAQDKADCQTPKVHVRISRKGDPSSGSSSMTATVEETPPLVANNEALVKFSPNFFQKSSNICRTPVTMATTNCVEETPPLEEASARSTGIVMETPSSTGSSCRSTFTSRRSTPTLASLIVPSGGKVTPPLCDCGKRAKRKIVVTPGPNEGLPFYVCPNGRGGGRMKRSCGYFRWECPSSSSTGTLYPIASDYGE